MPESYKDPLLQQAFKLYHKKKYQSVITTLETRIYNYRDSRIFYNILGVSCLFEREYSAALSYFSRSIELSEDDVDVLYCIGLVHYIRGRIRDALSYLLQVLTLDEGHRLSKRLLHYIRTDKSMARDHEFYVTAAIVPKFVPVDRKGLILVLSGIAFCGILGGALFLWLLTRPSAKDERFFLPRGALIIEATELSNSTETSNEFVLTNQEIREAFSEMETLFLENRDTEVRIIANRLLLSNISHEVRIRTEQILGVLEERPSFFDAIPDVSFSEIAAQPQLFDRVAVLWKGRVANLRASDERIVFDFLIGYVNQQTLEGIVQVEVEFPIVLENENSIEVLGLVTMQDETFYLDAISIRTNLE